MKAVLFQTQSPHLEPPHLYPHQKLSLLLVRPP
jgi:hypothetical protein